MKTIILNNYYPHLTDRVILEASDEITVTLSLVAGCVTATSATSMIMASVPWTLITGFEADMPYPPLSPEQPLETGEDRDPLHAAIVQLPPVQARRVHAYYILSVSKKSPGSRAWGSARFAKFKIV